MNLTQVALQQNLDRLELLLDGDDEALNLLGFIRNQFAQIANNDGIYFHDTEWRNAGRNGNYEG